MSQRRSASSAKEATDLLNSIYLRINKMAGSGEGDVPATFPALKDKLLLRLRAIATSQADFEKKVRSMELSLETKVG